MTPASADGQVVPDVTVMARVRPEGTPVKVSASVVPDVTTAARVREA